MYVNYLNNSWNAEADMKRQTSEIRRNNTNLYMHKIFQNRANVAENFVNELGNTQLSRFCAISSVFSNFNFVAEIFKNFKFLKK